MINKILKIQNIGKFKDLKSSNDDLSFKEYTLIFGPNKHGKTTLTSIFKSLKTAETDHLIGRKTFGTGVNEKQEYEILMGGTTKHTYNSGVINQNIEIFDNDFIHRNVFVGDAIDKNNKSSLYSILLDDKNIKLKENVDLLEKNHVTLTDEKNTIKNSIKDFESFIVLEDVHKIVDADKKLKENDNQKKQFLSQAQLTNLSTKSSFNYDFSVLEEKIKQNIDTTLESKINEHIKNNHKNNIGSKNFLKDGIGLISDNENCPFCSQSLDSVADHIEILKKFFSTTYKEIQDSINDSIKSFSQIDIEKEINAFKLCGLEFENLKIEELNAHFSKINEILKEKQTDLSKDIKIEENTDYINFKNEILKIKAELDKIKATTLDLQVLERESVKLNLNKVRFSDEGVAKFNSYKAKEKQLSDNKKSIDESIVEIKNELQALFSTHLEKINEVLVSSYANFKLKKLEPNTNRNLRDHMCEYSFVFDDSHDVNLDGESNVPNFKNTLSDSDKRVLAFAFFIARIKSGNNTQSKILVLDDPFTSLDEDRKDSMINLIKDLGFEQVIILSHSKRFIGRCFDLLPRDKMSTLKLHSAPATGTLFEVIDVKKEILDSDIEKDLGYIRNSISANKNLREACLKVRPCIEQLLKEKYLDFIKPESLSGNSSINTYLSDIGDKCPAKKDIEDNYWHDEHHAQSPIKTADDTERYNKLKFFIENILPKI